MFKKLISLLLLLTFISQGVLEIGTTATMERSLYKKFSTLRPIAYRLSTAETFSGSRAVLKASSAGEARASLASNIIMDTYYNLHPATSVERRKLVEDFLRNQHPLALEVFADIDSQGNADLNQSIDMALGIGSIPHRGQRGLQYSTYSNRFLDLRDLFLRPTLGGTDLGQLLGAKAIDWMLDLDTVLRVKDRDFIVSPLQSRYLLLKRAEQLSRSISEGRHVLIHETEIPELVDYYKQHADYILGSFNFWIYADILMPANTSAKRESIKNFLQVLTRLSIESKAWHEHLNLPENQSRISAIAEAASISYDEMNARERAAYPARLQDEIRESLIHATSGLGLLPLIQGVPDGFRSEADSFRKELELEITGKDLTENTDALAAFLRERCEAFEASRRRWHRIKIFGVQYSPEAAALGNLRNYIELHLDRMASKLESLSEASKGSSAGKGEIYRENEEFGERLRALDSIQISGILNHLIFYRQNAETPSHEQQNLFLLSKALSVALSGKDKDPFIKYLRSIVMLPKEALPPRARILIESYLAIVEIDKPTSVWTVNAMYHEQQRLQRPTEVEGGEDALRLSLQQLRDLYAINPLVDWGLIMVNDGDDRSDTDIRYKKRSSDIANDILLEGFPEYYSGKGSTGSRVQIYDMPQEMREVIQSVKGGAIIYGMRQALNMGADFVIFTDQDISIDLSQEGALLEPLIKDRADAAMGLRHGHDAAIRRPFGNLLRHHGFLLYTKGLIPAIRGFTDTQAGFKAYKREALERIMPLDARGRHDADFEYGGAFDVNLIGRLKKAGMRVEQVPVCYYESELSTFGSVGSAYKMAKGILRVKDYLGEWEPKKSSSAGVNSVSKDITIGLTNGIHTRPSTLIALTCSHILKSSGNEICLSISFPEIPHLSPLENPVGTFHVLTYDDYLKKGAKVALNVSGPCKKEVLVALAEILIEYMTNTKYDNGMGHIGDIPPWLKLKIDKIINPKASSSGHKRPDTDLEGAELLKELKLVPDLPVEFPLSQAGLQAILDRTEYAEDELIRDSNDTAVLRRKGLGVALKIPNGGSDRDIQATQEAYAAAQARLGGLTARFSMGISARVNFKGQQHEVENVMVQEEVIPLTEFIENVLSSRGLDDEIKFKVLKYILEEKAELDRAILNRGVYIDDLFLKQYGVNSEGKVVLIDLGSATLDPKTAVQDLVDLTYKHRENKGFEHRLNKRGYTLYHSIDYVARHAKGILSNGKIKELIAHYVAATKLPFSLDVYNLEAILIGSNVEVEELVGDELVDVCQRFYGCALASKGSLQGAAVMLGLGEAFVQYYLRTKYAEELIRIARIEFDDNFLQGASNSGLLDTVASTIIEESILGPEPAFIAGKTLSAVDSAA